MNKSKTHAALNRQNNGRANNPPKLAVIVSMMSGLESFVKREIETLKDRGYQIKLFATKHRPSPGFEPRADIPFKTPSPIAAIAGLITWGIRSPFTTYNLLIEALKFKGITELLLALSWANTLLSDNTQIIHCAFGDRKYFTGYFLHRLTGLPLTVAIHAHEIYAQPNPALFKHALKYTSGIVTISNKNKRLLCEKYSIDPANIDVIRLSIDLDFWREQHHKTNILTVARFTPRKGWHELIEVAKKLGPNFHFYGVGFGDLDVKKLANELGVGGQFTIFPKLPPDHLRLLMSACDIFCLPSKPTKDEGSEGIPVVLMEAMAMDMPIVTTADGSISELVDEEVVPPNDIEALASALLKSSTNINRNQPAHKNNNNRKRVSLLHSEENINQLDSFFSTRSKKA